MLTVFGGIGVIALLTAVLVWRGRLRRWVDGEPHTLVVAVGFGLVAVSVGLVLPFALTLIPDQPAGEPRTWAGLVVALVGVLGLVAGTVLLACDSVLGLTTRRWDQWLYRWVAEHRRPPRTGRSTRL